MAELELTRDREDRRLYTLAGVGSLRLEGLMSRSATANADGETWRIARAGLWGRKIQAAGADGSLAGEFDPRAIRRGGELRWRGQVFELRPASHWRERYALARGDAELAVIEGKGWGRRPVKVQTAGGEAIDPGLLLFAAYVVRGLADDSSAGAAAAASSTAATTS
jgi:hypothetical protein